MARIGDSSRPLPYARFAGVPPPPNSYPGADSAPTGPYALSADMAAKCSPLFAQCDTDGDGFVDQGDAAGLFGKSGLTSNVRPWWAR